MNAADEVNRLLKEHNAVLVRQGKHLVYRLPNGQNFVLAKTSGDPARAAKNNLSDLRRALGIVREAPEKGVMETQTMPSVAVQPQEPVQPEQHQLETLKERIETAIAREEAAQEKLLAEAQAVERCLLMLKAVLPFAEDPAAASVLRQVLPVVEPVQPATPEPAAPREPPQQITERVQVTRQLVFAATQTFEDTFTVNDVMALMTGGRQIDGRERLRVRQSISQAMLSLYERGELIREAEGYGRRQNIWRKASLKRDVTKIGNRG
jgi:hypothetical protein